MVALVVKGCGNLRPPEPKYDVTWDVSRVFKLLKKWGDNEQLSLIKLSKKLVMLLLCTAQRGQTIRRFHLSGLMFARFHMKHMLKHNQPGQPLSSIRLYAFNEDKNICPVRCLRSYIHRTKKISGSLLPHQSLIMQ